MGELISALHRLQDIELEISRLRRQEERKARQVSIAERQIRQIDEEVGELQSRCALQQRELDQLEQEVKGREASILKHRDELLRARTNKDYSAILTAINMEKADTGKIEKAALEKLAEVEALQEQVQAQVEERDSISERLKVAESALKDYRAKTADQRADLEKQREAASDALPTTAKATFSRVAERHDGEALAEILKLHPKREEYACGGCNMQIPLDSVNNVRLQDEIRMCPTCGRILYAAENSAMGT